MSLSLRRKIDITALNTGVSVDLVNRVIMEYLRITSQDAFLDKMKNLVDEYPPTMLTPLGVEHPLTYDLKPDRRKS